MTETVRVRQAELARRLGVTRGAVNQLCKRGIIEVGQDGLIDLELAKVAIEARVGPHSRTAQGVAGGTPAKAHAAPDEAPAVAASYASSRALREAAEATMAQLRLSELKGEVIRVDAVRAAWARRLSTTRDAILQIPIRVAPLLAAETSIEQVSILLETELRQALADLSQDGASGIGQAEGAPA